MQNRVTMFFAFICIAGVFAGQNSELFRFCVALLVAYEGSDIVRDKFRAISGWHWLAGIATWMLIGGLFFVAAASALGVLLSGPDIPR